MKREGGGREREHGRSKRTIGNGEREKEVLRVPRLAGESEYVTLREGQGGPTRGANIGKRT